MNILWLDDDAPAHSFSVGPVFIRTAGSCEEASKILLAGDLPDWIIVDLIVPQGKWGESAIRLPGLSFIEFVSLEYHKKIKLAAFSVAMSSELEEQLLAIGAERCYAKSNCAFMSVVEDLRKSAAKKDFEEKIEFSDDPQLDYDLALTSELSRIIESLLEKIYLSTKAVTEREIADLHKAKLTIENDREKRLRSYQTLQALSDSTELKGTSPPHSDSTDLEQLKQTVELIINHKRTHHLFDVFLSYNTADVSEVEVLANALKTNGILPWFDRWEIRPGTRWQNELGKQIESIKYAAVMIGQSGLGPWHELEIEAFLMQFVKRGSTVIPVLLPSAASIPQLPIFLRGASWVDLRRGGSDTLQRLLWAIIG